jgi:hypothetical protein
MASRRMKLVGHVARLGRSEMRTELLFELLKKRYRLENMREWNDNIKMNLNRI